MEWLDVALTPAVLVGIAALAWRVMRAQRADTRGEVVNAVEGLRTELSGFQTEVRADLKELRRDVAEVDKRLVAVETLLQHDRRKEG